MSKTNAIADRAIGFGYDHAGNRTSAERNGETDTFVVNSVNELTSVQHNANVLPVRGFYDSAGSVLVDGVTSARHDDYFYYGAFGGAASSQPNWKTANITTSGGPGGSASRSGYVPPLLEDMRTYDAEGNLTADARWVYSYDSENRLISMETHAIARASGIPHEKLEFKYDYLSRRIEKKYTNYTTAGQNYTRTFVWQGWTLLAELDGGSHNLHQAYSWNGSQLLALTQGATTYLAVYDDKSVTGLVNATTGELDAAYEYTAYGETLRASGQAIAQDNPIRCSSYYTDRETGLIYYGYRYYNPANGRFINRDPIAEAGGRNLYAFVGNDPVNKGDYLGLSPWGIENAGTDARGNTALMRSHQWYIDVPSNAHGPSHDGKPSFADRLNQELRRLGSGYRIEGSPYSKASGWKKRRCAGAQG